MRSSLQPKHGQFLNWMVAHNVLDMIYIFTDVVEFPKVQVRFGKGSDLKQYTKGSIPFKDRDVLFG